jgi:RimJ/RimL family protein N-acetyltransferase
LDLRRFCESDLDGLAAVFAQPEVWRLGLRAICSLPQALNPASVAVCERIGMVFERVVNIPANTRRGEVAARLYWARRADWAKRDTP